MVIFRRCAVFALGFLYITSAHASEVDVCKEAIASGVEVTSIIAEKHGKLSQSEHEGLSKAIKDQSKAIVQGTPYEGQEGTIERYISTVPSAIFKGVQAGLTVDQVLDAGYSACKEEMGEAI